MLIFVFDEFTIFFFSFIESLDSALHECERHKIEIESLKEQNEQLFQQYEREKGFHIEYQQVFCFCSFNFLSNLMIKILLNLKRCLQVEDHLEEIKREDEEKLRSLESIVKIFEIKARNASDHIGRLEDKENEMKQDHTRLHDRYREVRNIFDFTFFVIFVVSVVPSSL